VLAAGEEEGHWWLSRGVHRCSGSEMVSLGMPRLLPRSKEPRCGIIEVAGVSTTTLAVWPRRTATSAVDKLHPATKSAPLLIFSPSRHYPARVQHESPRSARILAQRSPVARGTEHKIFLRHCTMRTTFRAPDRVVCSAQISNFHVITC
jgi:hypothetical protein